MRTTIDSAGRVVIPKAIREKVGLRPGMALDIACRDGHIEIEPAPSRVELVREGRLLVASFPDTAEKLPDDIVERVRREIEDERLGPAS